LLFYSPRFYPLVGGLEKVVESWGNELVKKGVLVTLVTITASAEPDQYQFRVFRRPSFFKTLKLMREADLVVQFNVALKGLPVWLLSGRPLLITHHTLLYEPGTKAPFNQRLKLFVSNRLTTQNISCSRYIASQFKKAVVVQSPYNPQVFKNLQLDRKPGSVVFAGRLVTDKGVDILLNAISLLHGSVFSELIIVGDGQEKQALEKLAASLNIAGRVFFAGKKKPEELVIILNQSELMVVPSVVEPFGITVLEGLACGCRMVVSNTGGLPEGAGGFAELFESGNVQALADAIRKTFNAPRAINQAELDKHLTGLTIEHTAARFLEEVKKSL
jgi:glycosyltransferase involved in cell wall biosynthesis